MDVNQFMAAYGIDANNLSPTQKAGVNEVLRAGGYAAIQALVQILTAENSKANTTTAPTADAQRRTAQAALDAANLAEAERLKQRRSRIIIASIVGVTLVVMVAAYALYRKHRGNGR